MNEAPRRQIAELSSAENIAQIFMISQPVLRTTSRGDFYIAAFLSDRTGRVNSRMWQASEAVYRTLPQEGFVWVKGRTELYQNNMQIVVDDIKPVDIDHVDLMDFMPTTGKNIEAMFQQLKQILFTHVKNHHLLTLIQAFFDDEELMNLFCKAPAAITLHHAYIGGLLEHTLSLVELAARVMPHYPELNADLVLTGLFLHDIGKTTELDYDISFKYSDQGHLIGHLVKGVLLIEEKIRHLNAESDSRFPQRLADCLEHIIVSHHGIREFGCPVLPSTPEAYAVHYLDNLDSKIALTLSEISSDTNKSNWTHYIKALDTPLFKAKCDE